MIDCGLGVSLEITQPKERYKCREAHIHNNMIKVAEDGSKVVLAAQEDRRW